MNKNSTIKEVLIVAWNILDRNFRQYEIATMLVAHQSTVSLMRRNEKWICTNGDRIIRALKSVLLERGESLPYRDQIDGFRAVILYQDLKTVERRLPSDAVVSCQ